MVTKRGSVAGLAAALLAVSGLASSANSGDLQSTGQSHATGSYTATGQLAANQNGTPSTEDVARTLVNSSIDYVLPTLGENVPDALKRVELEVKIQDNLKPEWAVLTVQPLYQTPDKGKTVFTQLSQRHYNYLGTNRDVSNVGLGYRHLFADNTVLAGVNAFFDYEWRRAHKRGGVGAELKWSGVDFTANSYFALSNKSGTGLASGTKEEVLDGRDFELSAQVPFLPWAKVHGRKYYWDSVANSEDVNGWSASLEADVQQNLKIEAGLTDDNFIDKREKFAKVTFHIPFGEPRPAMLSSQWVSSTAWNMRDMRNYTLDKVRRQNKIIVERTGSGVVITRGN